jgi:hypothetical protein
VDYHQFLERVIEEGIEAAKADYVKPEQKPHLEGSIDGFESCRGKTPEELRELFSISKHDQGEAYWKYQEDLDSYWRVNCRGLEIEWVCNVVSAMLLNQGAAPIIEMVTARGVMKAAEILGVAA